MSQLEANKARMRRFGLVALAFLLVGGCYARPSLEPGGYAADRFVGRQGKPSAIRAYAIEDLPMYAPAYTAISGGSDARLRLTNLTFLLIRENERILIDAGLGSYRGELATAPLSRLFYSLIPYDDGPGEALVSERLGRLHDLDASQPVLRPEDVTSIIVTHPHSDHLGGVFDFPNAVIYMANQAKADLFDASSRTNQALPRTYLDRLAAMDAAGRLRTFDFADSPYGTFARTHRFWPGDDALVLLDAPGHLGGHTAAMLNLPNGRRILLTGDAASLGEGVVTARRKGWLVSHLVDGAENDDTLMRMHRLTRLDPNLTVITSHDPEAIVPFGPVFGVARLDQRLPTKPKSSPDCPCDPPSRKEPTP